jgi:hypothetical protein
VIRCAWPPTCMATSRSACTCGNRRPVVVPFGVNGSPDGSRVLPAMCRSARFSWTNRPRSSDGDGDGLRWSADPGRGPGQPFWRGPPSPPPDNWAEMSPRGLPQATVAAAEGIQAALPMGERWLVRVELRGLEPLPPHCQALMITFAALRRHAIQAFDQRFPVLANLGEQDRTTSDFGQLQPQLQPCPPLVTVA